MIILIASNNSKYFSNSHSNYNYIDNLFVLLKSIDTFHENETVSIYLINCSINIDSKLTKIHTNTIINHLNKGGNNLEIRNFSAHLRAKMIYNEFKNKQTKYILYLDTDTLVRKPLNELLYSEYTYPTIKILTRNNQNPDLQVQNAVFLLNNTKITRNMLNWWASYIENNDKSNDLNAWFADQRGLNLAINKYKLKVIELPEKFNDPLFKSTSHIWHCKGRYSNSNWKKEYNEILQKIG